MIELHDKPRGWDLPMELLASIPPGYPGAELRDLRVDFDLRTQDDVRTQIRRLRDRVNLREGTAPSGRLLGGRASRTAVVWIDPDHWPLARWLANDYWQTVHPLTVEGGHLPVGAV